MLGYQCTNRCRHCLYRCSPAATDWMDPATLDRTLDALAREPHLDGIHLAGGEAVLNLPLLLEAVREARKRNIRLDYLETNAAWVKRESVALERFEALRDAGLDAVLISATPFHNEHIPLERTALAIRAARKVFPAGVIVWTPQLYQAMSALDPARTHRIQEFLKTCGLEEEPERLRGLFPLTPAGRVAEELRFCYKPREARSFEGDNCLRELQGVSHFHVDPQGHLFTGLCPGIAVGDSECFHPEITQEAYPIFTALSLAGPWGLAQTLGREHGFAPRRSGYISKCDLCMHVRMVLRRGGDFRELRSDGFYADPGPQNDPDFFR
jgi:pyruvate-formate lyase-activating enzyme